MILGTLVHWADVLAVPLFLLATLYFWQIPKKSGVEWLLLVFSVGGFVLDSVFTLAFLNVF